MKSIFTAMAIATMVALAPMQATAAGGYEVHNVMDDALYGGGVGAMVGLGIMLISDKPTDNWNYVTRGAGFGIIAGAAFGIVRSSRAFAQVEDGKIQLGVPSPQFALQETPAGLDLRIKADLIHSTF